MCRIELSCSADGVLGDKDAIMPTMAEMLIMVKITPAMIKPVTVANVYFKKSFI